MKNSNVFKTIGLMACMILFLSCSAEDGDVGPQGPQGEQGPAGAQGLQGEQGPAGADGQDGADGQNGNANVIYSNWIPADWNLLDLPRVKEMRIPVTEIGIDELRNKTLVFVYFTQWGDGRVHAMPSGGRWSNTWYSFTFGNRGINSQGIVVLLESTNGVDLTENQYSGSRNNDFRYVLVPESAPSGKLDYTDYQAVKAYYNLPD
ncbi:collagen-like protein [Flavobacteriaceae bacterium 3-367]|uniref:collagen-like triple helix repeat-containing protein n=1 Tax=Eudoraea algarum TaxID=3417568 RepID=UPI0032960636